MPLSLSPAMSTSLEEISSSEESAGIGIVLASVALRALALFVIFSVQSIALVVVIILQASTESTIRVVPDGTAARTSVSEAEVNLALELEKVSAISGFLS